MVASHRLRGFNHTPQPLTLADKAIGSKPVFGFPFVQLENILSSTSWPFVEIKGFDLLLHRGVVLLVSGPLILLVTVLFKHFLVSLKLHSESWIRVDLASCFPCQQ